MDTVVGITYERTDDFFDLTVPGHGHYFADGFWHHNTGKTRACLEKIDALLWKYAGSQAVIVRKVRDTMHASVLSTFRKKVLGEESPVIPHGGEKAEWFDYPNGSRLWVAGMDNPGKALSSERDFVVINQAEELTLTDYETLTTRCTGRAGNSPYPQVMGDCNPGPPHHWIRQRPQIKLLESRHEDNPVLYDDAGQLTEQGKRTIAALDSLTGVRKERLRYGRWVSAEGAVYEFDPRLHVVEPFVIPASWPRARAVDFGYSNPFVMLWGALDGDGRLYIYRQWYMSQRTVTDHAARIRDLSHGERYEITVADHDREDRETLHQCGIGTAPAEKALLPGIQAVEDRLKVAGDGTPRLFVLRGSLVERDERLAAAGSPVCLEQEMDAYQYAKGADGRPVKEQPLDKDNHAADALRYLVRWADRRAAGGIADIRSGGGVFSRPGIAPGPNPFAGGKGRVSKPNLKLPW